MKLDKRHPLYLEDLDYILSLPGIDALRGRTFLITGASGLLGVQLIDALMRLGDVKVIAVGRSRQKAEARLGEHFESPLFRFVEQDVCLPFDRSLSPDYIVPLASNTHPLAYSEHPVETIRTNFDGALNALELASCCDATVLYPSSVEIYGDSPDGTAFEEDNTGALNLSTPRSCYTESKRVCEALCQSYAAQKKVKVKIVRLSRVFGPTMLESDTKASSQFILNALRGEDIVLKSDGTQSFSYTYVADAVAAMLHVLLNGENATPYNISCDGCNVRLKDFAEICAESCGKKVVFDIPSGAESRGYSIARSAILSNRRLTASGFAAKREIRDAISRSIRILCACGEGGL